MRNAGVRTIPMLGPHRAARVAELVRESRPHVVVEVGTAIGYSGLWIADVLRELGEGRLITLELDPERAAEAGRQLRAPGVQHLITQIVGDARDGGRQDQGDSRFALSRWRLQQLLSVLARCSVTTAAGLAAGRGQRGKGRRRNGGLPGIRALSLCEPHRMV